MTIIFIDKNQEEELKESNSDFMAADFMAGVELGRREGKENIKCENCSCCNAQNHLCHACLKVAKQEGKAEVLKDEIEFLEWSIKSINAEILSANERVANYPKNCNNATQSLIILIMCLTPLNKRLAKLKSGDKT